METIHLGCHNNQSSYSTRTKKNTIYVEANVPGMYAKFQLQPLYSLCEDFSKIYPSNRPGNQSN